MQIRYLHHIYIALSLCFFLCTACVHHEKEPVRPQPAPVRFATHIKPMIEARCSSCHTSNPRLPLYNDYQNTRRDIQNIIERTSRTPQEDGFMPKNREPLPQAEIQLLKQWVQQGMLQ